MIPTATGSTRSFRSSAMSPGQFPRSALSAPSVVSALHSPRRTALSRAISRVSHKASGLLFNSTFIALVLSIILMFFIHQLQLRQERLILDADSYCQQNLINKLRTKPLP